MKRVVPKIRVADGKLLTLKELSRAKDAAITRTDDCFRAWIQRGVTMQGVIVHLPHIRIGKQYFSSLPGLRAFLEVLQDVSHATTARLADSLGPPVVALKGDVFEKGGK
jgi:hypothetical protein